MAPHRRLQAFAKSAGARLVGRGTVWLGGLDSALHPERQRVEGRADAGEHRAQDRVPVCVDAGLIVVKGIMIPTLDGVGQVYPVYWGSNSRR